MPPFEQLKTMMPASPKYWLVTGAAGFIGSNLVETLLLLDILTPKEQVVTIFTSLKQI